MKFFFEFFLTFWLILWTLVNNKWILRVRFLAPLWPKVSGANGLGGWAGFVCPSVRLSVCLSTFTKNFSTPSLFIRFRWNWGQLLNETWATKLQSRFFDITPKGLPRGYPLILRKIFLLPQFSSNFYENLCQGWMNQGLQSYRAVFSISPQGACPGTAP